MPQKPQARAKDKRRLTRRLAKWRAKHEARQAPVDHGKPAAAASSSQKPAARAAK